MNSYVGRHAELYDVIYKEKPYALEASVIHDKLQRFSYGQVQRVLELACGTGRHAFELEKFGYRILATDYSEDLLSVARRNAINRGSAVEFRFQDMRKLELSEPFDAVYCLFDSIGYVQSNEGLQQVFDGVFRHLRQDRLFIFEFWHAAAMLCGYEPRRERHWKTEHGELKRVATTRLDVAKQLAKVTYQFDEQEDGKSRRFTETQVNRYFLVQEMAFFLQNTGFDPLEWTAAFQDNPAITEKTWHILAVARRR